MTKANSEKWFSVVKNILAIALYFPTVQTPGPFDKKYPSGLKSSMS
jgi:hypothetical protein